MFIASLIFIAALGGTAIGYALAWQSNRHRNRALRADLKRVVDKLKCLEHELDQPLAATATRAAFELECG